MHFFVNCRIGCFLVDVKLFCGAVVSFCENVYQTLEHPPTDLVFKQILCDVNHPPQPFLFSILLSLFSTEYRIYRVCLG